MCGRISLFAELGNLASQFRFVPGPTSAAYRPCWNIAPTAPVLAITTAGAQRHASLMAWGFSFNRPPGRGASSRTLFNARGETLTERPAFRAAFARRRCLIPANGFYEWRPNGSGGKTPLWIHRADERPFALAGIYNATPTVAASLITCAPNTLLAPIHNRMPVLLVDDQYDDWLAPDTDVEILQALLTPREWPDLIARPVSGAVNRASADGPELIAPVVNTTALLL